MAKKAAATPEQAKVITLDQTQRRQAQTQVATIIAEAAGINVIANNEQCLQAGEFLAKVQRVRRFVKGVFQIAKAPINQAKKDLDAEERRIIDPLVAVEGRVTDKIQEFRAIEARERARIAEEERKRREEQARQEQAAKAAELRAAAQEAESKRVAKMLEQQAKNIEKAEPIIDPVDEDEEEQTLPSGVYERTTRGGEVYDVEKLVLQVAAQAMITKHGAPPNVVAWLQQNFKPNQQATMSCVQPHQPTIRTLANRLGPDLALQGVTVITKTGLVSRG